MLRSVATDRLAKEGNWRAFLVGLLAVAALAGALRFYRLDKPSFWTDEMFTFRDAFKGARPGYIETRWALLLSGMDVASARPDGYGAWLSEGLNEWNGRAASAVLGTAAVLVLALVSSAAIGYVPALVLALLLGLCTWHIQWSQSARFYAPMFLYYNGALVLYLVGSLRRWPWALVLSMGAALLAVSTKVTSLMVFGAIGIDVLGQIVRGRRLWSLKGELAFVLAPVVLVLLSIGRDTGIQEFAMRELGETPLRTILGNIHMVGLPVCALALGGVFMAWRGHRRLVVFFVAATVVPLISFGYLSTKMHVEIRYTFVNVYGWLALAALGAWTLQQYLRVKLGKLLGWLPLVIVLCGMLSADAVYFHPACGNRPRWRDAFAYVREHRKHGEGVIGQGTWAGKYYLEDNGVRNVRLEFDGLASLEQNTWFVLKKGYGGGLGEHCDLRATFENRTAYPQDTVEVLYYRIPAVESGSAR